MVGVGVAVPVAVAVAVGVGVLVAVAVGVAVLVGIAACVAAANATIWAASLSFLSVFRRPSKKAMAIHATKTGAKARHLAVKNALTQRNETNNQTITKNPCTDLSMELGTSWGMAATKTIGSKNRSRNISEVAIGDGVSCFMRLTAGVVLLWNKSCVAHFHYSIVPSCGG